MTGACPHHPEVVDGLAACSRCGQTFCPDCLIQLQGMPVCATCKAQGVLDIQSNSRLMQEEAFPLASRWSRLGGRIIDNVICALAISPWWLPRFLYRFSTAHSAHGFTRGESYLFLVVVLLYDSCMILGCGQTLGKMAMRTVVVQVSGEPVQARHALMRAATRVAFEGLRYLAPGLRFVIALLPMTIFLEQRRCLHDYCASTIVVKKPSSMSQKQKGPA
jgi:uncharacterized RDD family membrane protein YckC